MSQEKKQPTLLDQESEGAQPTKPAADPAPAQQQPAPPAQQQLPAQRQQGNNQSVMDPSTEVGFTTAGGFALMQRGAAALMAGTLIPKAFQGNLSNCMIAINMAHRMNADPLMVMQNLYVVHGTPSFSSKFLIGTFNACGRYESIKYQWIKDANGKNIGCVAYSKEKASGDRIEGPAVTLEIAKAEGWLDKPGSKWKTMPDMMMMYRAASMMIRAYAPELSMGFSTKEEVEDVGVEVVDSTPGAGRTELPPGTVITTPRPARISDHELGLAMNRVKAGEPYAAIIEEIETRLGRPLAADQCDTIKSAASK